MINKAHIKIGDVVYGSSDSVDIMYDENTNVYDKITNISNTMAYIDIEDNENVNDISTVLTTSDVVDDFNSTSKTSPLSANKGRELKEGINELSEDIDKLPEFEKSDNTDGLIIVDSKGNIGVHLGSLKVWEQFSYNKKYGWGSYPYGTGTLPPFSRISGVFEADMLSVHGGKGRWNGTDTGNFKHGGHVFEGWNKEEDVRLTAGIGLTNKNIAWIQTFHPATEDGSNNGAYYGITKVGSDLDGQGVDFLPKVAQCLATLVLWSRPTEYTPTIPNEQLNMLVETREIPESIVNRTDKMIYGAMYYDTTLDRIRVYTKKGWKSLAFEEE